jgi:hypothetical protein
VTNRATLKLGEAGESHGGKTHGQGPRSNRGCCDMDRRAVLSKSQDQQQPHMRRRDFDHSEGRGERNIILELGRKFTANSSSPKHYKVISGSGARSPYVVEDMAVVQPCYAMRVLLLRSGHELQSATGRIGRK